MARMQKREYKTLHLKKMYGHAQMRVLNVEQARTKKQTDRLNDARLPKPQERTRTWLSTWPAQRSISAKPVIAIKRSGEPRTKSMQIDWLDWPTTTATGASVCTTRICVTARDLARIKRGFIGLTEPKYANVSGSAQTSLTLSQLKKLYAADRKRHKPGSSQQVEARTFVKARQ